MGFRAGTLPTIDPRYIRSKGVRMRAVNAVGPLTTAGVVLNTFDDALSDTYDRGGYFSPASPSLFTVPSGLGGSYAVQFRGETTFGNSTQVGIWVDIRDDLNNIIARERFAPLETSLWVVLSAPAFDLAEGRSLDIAVGIARDLQAASPDLRCYLENYVFEMHLLGSAT